jgi:hypothetical protein
MRLGLRDLIGGYWQDTKPVTRILELWIARSFPEAHPSLAAHLVPLSFPPTNSFYHAMNSCDHASIRTFHHAGELSPCSNPSCFVSGAALLARLEPMILGPELVRSRYLHPSCGIPHQLWAPTRSYISWRRATHASELISFQHFDTS